MPPVAAFVATVFTAVSTTVAAIGATTIFGTSLTIATAFKVATTIMSVASLFLSRKMPKPESQGQQLETKLDPQAPVPVAFGRTATGGYLVYQGSWGQKNKYLGTVTVLSAGGPIEGVESHLFGDYGALYSGDPHTGLRTLSAITPSASGSKLYRNYTKTMWRRGDAPESTSLSTATGQAMPGFSSSAKLSGLAHAFLMLEHNQDAFPSGVPKSVWVLKGVKCYDPRKDSTFPGGSGSHRLDDSTTWEWSENPFICALAWCVGRFENSKKVWGIGAQADEIDWDAFIYGANVADENEWTCGGVVTTADDKFAVLATILQSGGGVAVAKGAQLSCSVNAPKTSVYTLGVEDVVGDVEVVNSTQWRDRANRIVPNYREPSQFWNVIAANAVSHADYVAEDGGEVRSVEHTMPMVQDAAQAGQLAAYELVNSREFLSFTATCKPRLLTVRVGDCITVNLPSVAANSQKCVVQAREFDATNLTVKLSLRAETDGKHDFALGRTDTPPASPSLSRFDPTDLDEPDAATWAITGNAITSANGVTSPAIILAANGLATADNPFAESVIVEFKANAASDWTPYLEAPAATQRVEVTGLSPATSYDLGVSYRTRDGLVTPRLQLGPVTTGASISGGVVPSGIDWTSNVIANRPVGLTANAAGYLNAALIAADATSTVQATLASLGANVTIIQGEIADIESGINTAWQEAQDQANAAAQSAAWAQANAAAAYADSTNATASATSALANAATALQGATWAQANAVTANTQRGYAQSNATSAATRAGWALSNATASQTSAGYAAANAATALERSTWADANAVIAATMASFALANATAAAANATTAQVQAGYATSNATAASTQATYASSNASAALSNATLSATRAGWALSNATIASTQAGYATSNATVAQTQAGLSTTFAGYAQANASTAQTQAGYASSNAAAAQTSAGLAATYSGYAGSNATAAQTSAGVASTQAGYATANAAIAQSNAALSATYAGQALSNATVANDHRGYAVANAAFAQSNATLSATYAGQVLSNATAAQTSAGVASTQAGYATSNAATASTQATLSATFAGYAQGNATAAQTSAGVASTQAGYATSNAATAQTQAGLSTTYAGQAQANATLAQTSAGYASANASLASSNASLAATYAGYADSNATAAQSSAGVASTQAGYATANAALAQTQAGLSATFSGYAQSNATIAQTQAGYASSNATSAQTSATLSATHAGYAGANATAAQTSAGVASTQAGYATSNAATASTQAGLSATYAGYASANATTANTQRGYATSNATIAQTQAGYASSNATAAQTSAGLAATYSGYAGSNATAAQTSAGVASTQAGYATSNASLALSNATLAATYSGYAGSNATAAQTSAGVASTQAGYATANAAIASTQSGLSVSYAAQAASTADAIQEVANQLLPDRPSRGEDFVTNAAGTTVLTDGAVVTVAGEGDVREFTTVKTVYTRGWLLVGTGRTFRFTNRTRVTVDGTDNRLVTGFRLYDASGTDLGTFSYGYVDTAHVVADGWQTLTRETTSAAIVAAQPTAVYIRPLVMGGRNASSAASGATWQIASLSFRDITGEANAATSAGYAASNATIAQTQAGYATANASLASSNATLSATWAGHAASNATLANTRAGWAQANATIAQTQAGYSTANAALAASNATLSATYSGYAQSNATIAQTQAGYATSNASIATTQAGISTTWAGYAASNATAAQTQAGYAQSNAAIATTQAGFSSANAAFAQANATLAVTHSGYAAANSSAAQTQAGYSAANATISSTQAGYATSNASLASSNATLAATWAGHAASNATLANTRAGWAQSNATIASTQAGYATSNAATATTQAGLSTTWAGYAASNATAAQTQASYAQSNATIATTQAGYSTSNAASATTQAGLSTTWAGYAASNATAAQTQAGFAQANAAIATTQAGYSSANAAFALSNSALSATWAGHAASNATLANTRAGWAQSNATIASTQAGYASSNAAAASTSAALAATVAWEAINRNPTFAEEPWTSGTVPPRWSNWSSGTSNTKTTGLVSANGLQFAMTSSDTARGITQNYAGEPRLMATGPGYYVLEADVTLDAGSLAGSGILFQGATSANAIVQSEWISFATDKDITGAVVGAGTVGRTYRFAKLVNLGSTVARGLFFVMGRWSSFSPPAAAATVTFHKAVFRPATAGEIEVGVARSGETDLTARINSTYSVAATAAGRTVAYWDLVAAAGSDPAHVRVQADSYGSNIAMAATRFFLKNISNGALIDALKLVNGEAYFGAPISADVSGKRLTIGPGFGASSDLVLWFGANSTAIASMTKTNGHFSMATDGKVYYGNAEVTTGGGGSSGGAKVSSFSSGGGSGTTWITQTSVTFNSLPTTGFWTVTGGINAGRVVSGVSNYNGNWRIVESGSSAVLASGTFSVDNNSNMTAIVDCEISTGLVAKVTSGASVSLSLQTQRASGSNEVDSLSGGLNVTFTPQAS